MERKIMNDTIPMSSKPCLSTEYLPQLLKFRLQKVRYSQCRVYKRFLAWAFATLANGQWLTANGRIRCQMPDVRCQMTVVAKAAPSPQRLSEQ